MPRDAEDVRPLRPDAPENFPPHNDEAEMALLGAMLHNNRAYERVRDFLKPIHFANRVHADVYQAMEILIGRGEIADPITLKTYFEQHGVLNEIGGFTYLMRLAGSVASIVNAHDYGRTIYELHCRRAMMAFAEDMLKAASSLTLDLDAGKLHSQFADALQSIAPETAEQSIRHVTEATHAWRQRVDRAAKFKPGQMLGVPSSLRGVNALVMGYGRGDLIVRAGRPSMGKSLLAFQDAQHAALTTCFDDPERRHYVAVFSTEMSGEQIVARWAARAERIATRAQMSAGLTNEQLDRLMGFAENMKDMPIWIDDTPAVSLSQIAAGCRRIKRQEGYLDLVVIDYLQLMDIPGENRALGIGEVTRGLKKLARDLNVPVIALSQLSRNVENREDKRPQLADLRESGAIEQDADIVEFLFRADYYLERAKPVEDGKTKHEVFRQRMQTWQDALDAARGKVEVIIAKQRSGPIGTAMGHFDGAGMSIRDLEDAQDYGADPRPDVPLDAYWQDLDR